MSDWDKVHAAAYSLGELEHLAARPDVPSREQRLEQAVADLRAALLGSDEERVALEARRKAKHHEPCSPLPAADVPHRRGCVLPARHRGECRTEARPEGGAR